MKQEVKVLKIFVFSSFLMNTEVLGLLGHKFKNALPFSIELVNDIKESQLIIWDGVRTLKNNSAVSQMMELVGPKRHLLLLTDSKTLFENHSGAKVMSPHEYAIEMNGWTVLPEEILGALDQTYQKLNHA